ncbi:oxygen-independent coproporphyrinogen III oxidase [Marinicella sp. W31]|uniref:oxygen-independent coproporphyrinogen III oxidase n=1 Tax=Marinicella sp. W31 TaxID=3023713 RepID=UPI00375688D3
MTVNIMWNQQLIEKYNITGPRYTSYPTALQFSDEFTVPDYKKAFVRTDQAEPLGLYIHIPFCENICFYCACNKVVTKHKDRAERYLKALLIEAKKIAPLVAGRKVIHMHWGGGSPTFLSNHQIAYLFNSLREIFDFDLNAGEFAIEVDPRSIDRNTIPVLEQLGFNRLSVGVQDFNPEVQKAVNRIHSKSDVRALMLQARRYGFESVSMDFIYGLPFQTPKSFKESMQAVVQMAPDRVSVFNYAHLPSRFKSQRRINRYDLPEGNEKLKMMQAAIEVLTDAGYVFIGMDHFALPHDPLTQRQRSGELHRNFQGYSSHRNCDLVGLGVSAISHVDATYSQNQRDLDGYYKAVENDQVPLWRGCHQDNDDILRGEIIEQLICHFQLQYDAVEASYGIDFTDYFEDELMQLKSYESDGLLQLKPDGIVINYVGRLLIRNICMVFDRYLQEINQIQNYSKSI